MATIRQLMEFLKSADSQNQTNWMDAEVRFLVADGHRNSDYIALEIGDYWKFPRCGAHESTGEAAQLTFNLSLRKHRLVKEKETA